MPLSRSRSRPRSRPLSLPLSPLSISLYLDLSLSLSPDSPPGSVAEFLFRCRANMQQIRQSRLESSRPDSGHNFQVEVLKSCSLFARKRYLGTESLNGPGGSNASERERQRETGTETERG